MPTITVSGSELPPEWAEQLGLAPVTPETTYQVTVEISRPQPAPAGPGKWGRVARAMATEAALTGEAAAQLRAAAHDFRNGFAFQHDD